MIPDGEKAAPVAAEAMIGFLAGISVWVVTHDWVAGVIASLVAFFVASTKVGMFFIRIAVLIGFAWLAMAFFG